MLDSLFYVLRTGCQWRPRRPRSCRGRRCMATFAPSWTRACEPMRHHLVVMLREGMGREPSPTAAVIDSLAACRT